jgi:hypothetical protein
MIGARRAAAPRELGEYGAPKGRLSSGVSYRTGLRLSECEQNAQNREKRGLFAQLA